jgi:hypothetical protein
VKTKRPHATTKSTFDNFDPPKNIPNVTCKTY